MKRALQHAILASFLIATACATRGAVTAAADGAHEHAAEAPGPAAHAMAGGDHAHHDHGLPATDGPGHTAADVRFMQEMIGHHAQALVMAAMAPTHGAGEMVRKLALKIDISQRDEIAMMKAWLTERNQAVPADDHAHSPDMPGMLSPEQLARLDAARGSEFDRLFLTFMIQHHEGALRMVETLFDSPGAAQDPDIFRFATDVFADQLDEIDVMRHMLDLLAVNRGSENR